MLGEKNDRLFLFQQDDWGVQDADTEGWHLEEKADRPRSRPRRARRGRRKGGSVGSPDRGAGVQRGPPLPPPRVDFSVSSRRKSPTQECLLLSRVYVPLV